MKVAVFVDYANVNISSKNLGCRINYSALLEYLADVNEGRSLLVAHAYVPVNPRNEHAMDQCLEELWGSGYIVRSKVGTIAGETYKCNFDIEMTLDIVQTAFESKPDIVVIVSGDSDFIPVVLELRKKGVRVEVAGFSHSMSDLLSKRASGFISLDALMQGPDYEIDVPYDESVEESETEDQESDEIQTEFVSNSSPETGSSEEVWP